MPRRPKISASYYFKSILNPRAPAGVYELQERGITYQLDFEQFNDLKQSGCETVGEWYGSLDRFAKRNVKRIGAPATDDGFYPDE